MNSRSFLSLSSPKVHEWMPAFQPSGSRVQAFVLARSFLWNFLGGGQNFSLCQLWAINGWTYPEFVHLLGPSIDGLTHAQSDLQVSLCFVMPTFLEETPTSFSLLWSTPLRVLKDLHVFFLSVMVSWLDPQSFLSGPSFRGAVPFACLWLALWVWAWSVSFASGSVSFLRGPIQKQKGTDPKNGSDL